MILSGIFPTALANLSSRADSVATFLQQSIAGYQLTLTSERLQTTCDPSSTVTRSNTERHIQEEKYTCRH